MKLYALLLGILLSCTCYGVVTYKCEKDEIVYQMNSDEFFGAQYLVENRIFSFQRVFDLYFGLKSSSDLPGVLMMLENSTAFLDIIRYYSVLCEIFPELCGDDIDAVRAQFDIRERDICAEGQNQKLLAYLKEKYDTWKKSHKTNAGTETLHKSFLSGNIPGCTSFGEEEIVVPNYYGTSTESVDVPTPALDEDSLPEYLGNINRSDLIFEARRKR